MLLRSSVVPGWAMPKFRKRVVIEAWEVSENNWRELERMAPEVISFIGNRNGPEPEDLECLGLNIQTLEGTVFAEMGDWIIKGVKGEFYPCKPGSFDATYEPVS